MTTTTQSSNGAAPGVALTGVLYLAMTDRIRSLLADLHSPPSTSTDADQAKASDAEHCADDVEGEAKAGSEDCISRRQESEPKPAGAELRGEVAAWLGEDMVPFALLRRCADAADAEFDLLVRGSRVVFPAAPPKKEKSPELQRILDDIRRRNEHAEYVRMTGQVLGNPDPAHGQFSALANGGRGRGASSDKRAVLGMVNVMYTAISVFVAVWWVGPTISDNVALRVLVAFLLALIVLAAEAWLAFRSGTQRKME